MYNLRKMAEKLSFMGESRVSRGKNRVLSSLVKSSFPQNAQKSLTSSDINTQEEWCEISK